MIDPIVITIGNESHTSYGVTLHTEQKTVATDIDVVVGDSNLAKENIVKGVTLLGVEGNAPGSAEIEGKMDKVEGGTSGNLVSLTNDGNAQDSGVAASTIGTLSSGKMDKIFAAQTGNLIAFDAQGNASDSGLKTSKVAQIDGYYDGMTVGASDQLVSMRKIRDQVPYLFRASGGGNDIGNRLNDKIVGGTIAWNQLNNRAISSFTENGVTFSISQVGKIKITGTATANASWWAHSGILRAVTGHKVLIQFDSVEGIRFGDLNASKVVEPVSTANYGFYVTEGTVCNYESYVQFFDLTQMFGSTIADYVYSLEQATAGAGVAWFKKLFPKPYYEYNPGELMSVCTNAHITRGFNAWDGEKAIVIGGNEYYVNGTYGTLSLDGEEITVTANKFTPAHNGIITASSPSETLCINLSWSGYRNGEYEPYVEHRYPLSPIELRGIPKLDSANNLYYDGDTYEKDGTVTRKYYQYTFTGNETFVTQSSFGSIKMVSFAPSDNELPYMMSVGDVYSGEGFIATNILIAGSQGDGEHIARRYNDFRIFYPNTYANVKAYINAKNAANTPITVIYPVRDAITETADPFTDPQIVDDWGAEEYVDTRDVPMPVGHDTLYSANLRDKLQMLPNAPANTGDYIVHYDATTRTCTFKPFAEAVATALNLMTLNMSNTNNEGE